MKQHCPRSGRAHKRPPKCALHTQPNRHSGSHPAHAKHVHVVLSISPLSHVHTPIPWHAHSQFAHTQRLPQTNTLSHKNHTDYTQTLTNYMPTHTYYSTHILILHIWPTLKHTLVTYLHTSNTPHYMNTTGVVRMLSGLRLWRLSLMA